MGRSLLRDKKDIMVKFKGTIDALLVNLDKNQLKDKGRVNNDICTVSLEEFLSVLIYRARTSCKIDKFT